MVEYMKTVFVSNYYNHHQSSLCKSLFDATGENFRFVATSPISKERLAMGWGEQAQPEFVCDIHKAENNEAKCRQLIDGSDVVIWGDAPEHLVRNRINSKKLTFRYSERIYKKGYQVWRWPVRLLKFWQRYGKHKNLYLLCASAYTAADYGKHGVFLRKAYKWGYFPETKVYDVDALLEAKNPNVLMWCGRYIDWKHPEAAVEVAKRLKAEGYSFELRMIGTGVMENSLNRLVEEYGLQDCVKLLGSMKPEQVRQQMEQAGIYLFTSDFNEGWGAVLNESMNSGCAVVSSHGIGSVPFLIQHKENGFIYKNGDPEDLYQRVKYLLDHPQEQKRMGKNAYHTIVEVWNAEVAAKRFLRLTEEILDHGFCDLYEDGPCSRADRIGNHWFRG